MDMETGKKPPTLRTSAPALNNFGKFQNRNVKLECRAGTATIKKSYERVNEVKL
jgi:hypothetical protein